MFAVLVITLLALCFGLLLGYAAIRFKVKGDPVADKINAILPQTQCGQCSFAGCKPYAKAIAEGKAEINCCPPGGEQVIVELADLLGKEVLPLDPEAGIELEQPLIAIIREAECIGCTLCIQACPVDAILGAAKQMHTVIEAECTGCKLCVPPCPVECIDMLPIKTTLADWKFPAPNKDSDNV